MTFKELLLLPECGNFTAMTVKAILIENGLDFRERQSTKYLNQRNKLIVELISRGQSYKKVSEKIGVSPIRVQQIYKNRYSRSTSKTKTL